MWEAMLRLLYKFLIWLNSMNGVIVQEPLVALGKSWNGCHSWWNGFVLKTLVWHKVLHSNIMLRGQDCQLQFLSPFEYQQNPTWRSLDFGIMPDRLDTSVSCFVVRIWGGKKEHFQHLIEWKVNLDGLKYLGQQVMQKRFFFYLWFKEL